ncbi:transposase, partial [Flavobacterium sp. FZUC8N2.13]
NVTFDYKDYKQNGFKKQMILTHQEFIRRFAIHILPKGFVKIRHYGFLSSTWKRQKLGVLQSKLQVQPTVKTARATKIRKCQCCKTGNLHTILIFDKRGPPEWFLGDSQKANVYKN